MKMLKFEECISHAAYAKKNSYGCHSDLWSYVEVKTNK
jgi:hypothetical protein